MVLRAARKLIEFVLRERGGGWPARLGFHRLGNSANRGVPSQTPVEFQLIFCLKYPPDFKIGNVERVGDKHE
jgi:hypothetical protein